MTESQGQVCNNFAIVNENPLLRLYSIFDKKLKKFMPPFFASSDEDAVRQLTNIVNFSNSLICHFPEDYCLYLVGTFDETDGCVMSNYTEMSKFVDDFHVVKIIECAVLKTEDGLRWSELIKKVEDDRQQIASIVSDYHKCIKMLDDYEKKTTVLNTMFKNIEEKYPDVSKYKTLSGPKKSILNRLFSH